MLQGYLYTALRRTKFGDKTNKVHPVTFSGTIMCAFLLYFLLGSSLYGKPEVQPENWRFVSIPDFLNADTTYPQPGWEDALTFILSSIKKENPDFIIIPGDLIQGRWKSQDKIAKYSNIYYSAWKQRIENFGLKYYTSIGDHEIGDNPWFSPAKVKRVNICKQKFREYMNMPLNGPEHMRGTAYWFVHNKTLFISLDVFERGMGKSGKIVAKVTGRQLKWFRNLLKQHRDVRHKIVFGHTPILNKVNKESSSGLHIRRGRASAVWRAMKEFNVDLYLCGEVHAASFIQRDDILQVCHGSIIGINDSSNYLVVDLTPHKISMAIKEIPISNKGGKLWQPGLPVFRPHERIEISDAARTSGFKVKARAVIDKSNQRRTITLYDAEYARKISLVLIVLSIVAVITFVLIFRSRQIKRK